MRIQLLVVGVLCWASVAAAVEPTPFGRMAWMEGHWAGVTGEVQMEEHWTSAAGDGLVGMHKDVKAGRISGFEFFRIESHPDGVYYMTSPGGAPATPFKLVEQGERRVVFENAAHDFPQRILYWSPHPDTLCARIEGTINGKSRAKDWRWPRVKA